jgi:carbamoyltransferase
MINVGISRGHNASVALLIDGEIIFQIENERLSNIKYDWFPFLALNKIKDYVDHVDNVCIGGVGPKTSVDCFSDLDPYTTFIKGLNKSFYSHTIKVYDLWREHHKLHAACAFYNSGFEKAVCIIKDGMGSEYPITHSSFLPNTYGRECASTYVTEYPNKFTLIDKHVIVPFECDIKIDDIIRVSNHASEALAFQKTSKEFGFHELDAGKVMGLSSYGKEQTHVIFDGDYVSKEIIRFADKDLRQGYLNTNIPHDFQKEADFAYSLQQQSQAKVKEYILRMVEKTGCRNVCLSGGFFLNCVANYEYLKDLPSDIKIYVEPISSDAGTSIGAAQYVWHTETEDTTIRKQKSIYYGFEYKLTSQDIYNQLQEGESIQQVEASDIAKLIANKNIVAIYQGRSEAGPRALGNRSILYDPRDENGKDFVNEIKQREMFRPFAGTILHEHTDEWFDMRGLEESPFMMYAVDVKRKEIPAITHVDNTCRVQTLKKEQNYHYYRLIEEFYNLTDVPILFNTSFNLAGDCIVETIDDALRTIRNCSIKYLYLPELKILITK